jgi:hypothetical protein
MRERGGGVAKGPLLAAGGEGLAARLQRERGTAPWPLTYLEVLHIAATGDSSTVHCISPGCSNKVDIASALASMAHQPHGKCRVVCQLVLHISSVYLNLRFA